MLNNKLTQYKAKVDLTIPILWKICLELDTYLIL